MVTCAAEPFDSLVGKVLSPGRRNGYWGSYKSGIAAYELDTLLEMNMVPRAVERTIDVDKGAAIMWVTGPKSVMPVYSAKLLLPA